MLDARRTGLAGGAATLLSSHAEHPDRRRATQQKEVRPNRRQPQRESARRPVGTFSSASDVIDHRIETASLNAIAPIVERGPEWELALGRVVAYAPDATGRAEWRFCCSYAASVLGAQLGDTRSSA
jgi:hypothetical protein